MREKDFEAGGRSSLECIISKDVTARNIVIQSLASTSDAVQGLSRGLERQKGFHQSLSSCGTEYSKAVFTRS